MRRFRKDLRRRLTDALVTAAIKRGIGPSQLYLLTVVGRKTQTAHTTPVSVVIEGSARYLVGPYGVVNWVRNARQAGTATLARAGQIEEFSLEAVSPEKAAPILKLYLALEPITAPYFDVRADAPVEAFQAEVALHPVFRLTRKVQDSSRLPTQQ